MRIILTFLSALSICSTTLAQSSPSFVLGENQIVTTQLNSKKVIYKATTPEGKLGFFFCQDRDNLQTCRRLGTRDYTSAEIKALSDYYFEQAKKVKIKGYLAVMSGVALISLAILVPTSTPAAGFIGAMLIANGFGLAAGASNSDVATANFLLTLKQGSQANLSSVADRIDYLLKQVPGATSSLP